MSFKLKHANPIHNRILMALVPLSILVPHEHVIEDHVRELMEDLVRRGKMLRPIVVDIKTFVILDGHHRVEALKRLGKRYVPAILVDYDDDCVSVSSWRENWRVTKDLVRLSGLSGRLLPPKTSRHRLCVEIPEINVGIEVL